MDIAADPTLDRSAGLCATCRHLRVIVSDRGARYYLCRRSEEPGSPYPRYPRIPMLLCPGHEAAD